MLDDTRYPMESILVHEMGHTVRVWVTRGYSGITMGLHDDSFLTPSCWTTRSTPALRLTSNSSLLPKQLTLPSPPRPR